MTKKDFQDKQYREQLSFYKQMAEKIEENLSQLQNKAISVSRYKEQRGAIIQIMIDHENAPYDYVDARLPNEKVLSKPF